MYAVKMSDLQTDAMPVGGSSPARPCTYNTQETIPKNTNPREVNIVGGSNIHIGPKNYVTKTVVESEFTPEERPPKSHVILLLGSNREITEDDKGTISDHLGLKWRELGRKMKFSAGEIENLCADFPRSRDRAYELMCMWHDRESKAATLSKITIVLIDVKAYSALNHLKP